MEYIDLTEIIGAIIGLAVSMITVFLIPYIKEKWGAEKFEKVEKWVNIAVKAAEMIYHESGMGAQKKAFVVDYLKSKGFTLDPETLDNLIESAVLDLNRE